MTIAITLNSVQPSHHQQQQQHGGNLYRPTYSNETVSSPSKVRPHRKLQQYRSSPMTDSSYNKYCRPQLLSNGYTVVPMLSLQDAALLHHEQQQQERELQQREEMYRSERQQREHHSPSYRTTNQCYHSTTQYNPIPFEQEQERCRINNNSLYNRIMQNRNQVGSGNKDRHISKVMMSSRSPDRYSSSSSMSQEQQRQQPSQCNDLYEMPSYCSYPEESSTSSSSSSSSLSFSSLSTSMLSSPVQLVAHVSNSSMNNNYGPQHQHTLCTEPQSQQFQSQTVNEKKAKKQVRFAPMATLHTIPTATDEDIGNSWYTLEQYQQFEQDNRYIVSYIYQQIQQKMSSSKQSSNDNDRECYNKTSIQQLSRYLMEIIEKNSDVLRNNIDESNDDNNNRCNAAPPLLQYQIIGLESFLFGPKYMKQRRHDTMEHSIMVLELYDVQRSMNIYNPDIVRRVSERFSSPTVHRAIHRATTQYYNRDDFDMNANDVNHDDHCTDNDRGGGSDRVVRTTTNATAA